MRRISVCILSPSLNVSANVSGIASVMRELTACLAREVEFSQITVGRTDGATGLVHRLLELIGNARDTALNRAEIIHCNTALNPRSIVRDAVLAWIARLTGKKVFLHLHGGRYLSEGAPTAYRLLIRAMLSAGHSIVALSETEVRAIQRLYGRFPVLDYVYNGIALPPRPTRHTTAPLKVLFMGRLEDEKGVPQLLGAFSSINPETASLTIAGRGSLDRSVTEAAERQPNVTYVGVADRQAVTGLLQANDVLILPSLSGEGMPMAVIEAMSHGVAPIVTPIASIPEIVSDNFTGFYVASGEPGSIVALLRRLAGNPARVLAAGEAARAFAEKHLDSRAMAAKIGNLYCQLVSKA